MQRGKYIVIEGGEGCGKTTQVKLLVDWLNELKIPCYSGREPGGVAPAEEVRKILKNPEYKIDSVSELFGFAFARSLFFEQIAQPKIEMGIHLVLDRSGFSTEAYQGYAGRVSLKDIRLINEIAMRGIKPDLAFIIDNDPSVGLKKEIEKDRISSKGLEYHLKVRKGFLTIAHENPLCIIIPYRENDIMSMQNEVRMHVSKLLNLNL